MRSPKLFSELKINRAFRIAGIPDMPMTRSHILRNIKNNASMAVLASMSAKQLAAVISAAYFGYHDGRASKGDVEIIDGDALSISAGIDKFIEFADTRDNRRKPK